MNDVKEEIALAFDAFAERLREEAVWMLSSGSYPSDEQDIAASKALDTAADCARSLARSWRNR